MRWKGFYIGRAQRVAALLLLVLFAECCWTIAHSSLTAEDYRYARCGREMWERPGTTCGNLNGDGTFAYRVASLPLLVQRDVLLAADHLRKPENRVYASGSLNGTLWEARSELNLAPWLLRLPFVLFALWLGGGLWWVSKRLFGMLGGGLSLALYVFCPAVIHYAVHPNNEVGSTASSTRSSAWRTRCRDRAASGASVSSCSPWPLASPRPRTCWPRVSG
jgi:hypothetical protein